MPITTQPYHVPGAFPITGESKEPQESTRPDAMVNQPHRTQCASRLRDARQKILEGARKNPILSKENCRTLSFVTQPGDTPDYIDEHRLASESCTLLDKFNLKEDAALLRAAIKDNTDKAPVGGGSEKRRAMNILENLGIFKAGGSTASAQRKERPSMKHGGEKEAQTRLPAGSKPFGDSLPTSDQPTNIRQILINNNATKGRKSTPSADRTQYKSEEKDAIAKKFDELVKKFSSVLSGGDRDSRIAEFKQAKEQFERGDATNEQKDAALSKMKKCADEVETSGCSAVVRRQSEAKGDSHYALMEVHAALMKEIEELAATMLPGLEGETEKFKSDVRAQSTLFNAPGTTINEKKNALGQIRTLYAHYGATAREKLLLAEQELIDATATVLKDPSVSSKAKKGISRCLKKLKEAVKDVKNGSGVKLLKNAGAALLRALIFPFFPYSLYKRYLDHVLAFTERPLARSNVADVSKSKKAGPLAPDQDASFKSTSQDGSNPKSSEALEDEKAMLEKIEELEREVADLRSGTSPAQESYKKRLNALKEEKRMIEEMQELQSEIGDLQMAMKFRKNARDFILSII